MKGRRQEKRQAGQKEGREGEKEGKMERGRGAGILNDFGIHPVLNLTQVTFLHIIHVILTNIRSDRGTVFNFHQSRKQSSK